MTPSKWIIWSNFMTRAKINNSQIQFIWIIHRLFKNRRKIEKKSAIHERRVGDKIRNHFDYLIWTVTNMNSIHIRIRTEEYSLRLRKNSSWITSLWEYTSFYWNWKNGYLIFREKLPVARIIDSIMSSELLNEFQSRERMNEKPSVHIKCDHMSLNWNFIRLSYQV